jgi:hypothetical protein
LKPISGGATSGPLPAWRRGGPGRPSSALRPCATSANQDGAFTGFKRHVIELVDVDLIADAVVRPANEPEHATVAG